MKQPVAEVKAVSPKKNIRKRIKTILKLKQFEGGKNLWKKEE
jgi:hypothetical protein